ncbi:MAG: hypothetical protein D3M94_12855 [Rhodocyclales bacterium GT-UBC]|nr:MAG: hypothetical protein D3M94_12855 [Rhodocyclales bacterium GT-UBC]
MRVNWLGRCLAVLLLPLLAACSTRGIPAPSGTGEQAAARELLQRSAEAHGLNAWRGVNDISLSYTGEWAGLASRVQPVLVDAGYRQSTEERLLLGTTPLIAQHHEGPRGSKQVVRTPQTVRVHYDGLPDTQAERLAAAALVADGYRLFLTAPFHFLNGNLHLETGPDEMVDERLCATIIAVRRPGHGFSDEDRYQLFIDRTDYRLRRLRFSMEGLDSTRGAIAEVDFLEHREIAGVVWPVRFFERLRKPIPGLAVHSWWLTGLDVNRGLQAGEIEGPRFSGKAAPPAQGLVSP